MNNSAHYFGGCPECGDTNGYLNVGHDDGHITHVFICETHKTKWAVGTNLFSPDERDGAPTWAANDAKLRDYREVEPLPLTESAA